jgi:diadenosine tetraphosphate (Ap4A) HIT family hydrolase
VSEGTVCPFCAPENVLARNEHAYMIYDRYPASPGHVLVVSCRHLASFFDVSADERAAMLRLVDEAKRLLDRTRAPQGYNLGVNVGEIAGQTIMHCHLHVIPRYPGDCPDPRGGVRAVIPGKASY